MRRAAAPQSSSRLKPRPPTFQRLSRARRHALLERGGGQPLLALASHDADSECEEDGHGDRAGGDASAVPGHAQQGLQILVACAGACVQRIWSVGAVIRKAKSLALALQRGSPASLAQEFARHHTRSIRLPAHPTACSTRRRWWARA